MAALWERTARSASFLCYKKSSILKRNQFCGSFITAVLIAQNSNLEVPQQAGLPAKVLHRFVDCQFSAKDNFSQCHAMWTFSSNLGVLLHRRKIVCISLFGMEKCRSAKGRSCLASEFRIPLRGSIAQLQPLRQTELQCDHFALFLSRVCRGFKHCHETGSCRKFELVFGDNSHILHSDEGNQERGQLFQNLYVFFVFVFESSV